MLLGTLGASWLGNLLTGKEIERVSFGNNKGKGIVRAGSGKQLEPRFNGVFSRNNLPKKIKMRHI